MKEKISFLLIINYSYYYFSFHFPCHLTVKHQPSQGPVSEGPGVKLNEDQKALSKLLISFIIQNSHRCAYKLPSFPWWENPGGEVAVISLQHKYWFTFLKNQNKQGKAGNCFARQGKWTSSDRDYILESFLTRFGRQSKGPSRAYPLEFVNGKPVFNLQGSAKCFSKTK